MDQGLLPRGRFFQNAWIVPDLEAAIAHWAQTAKVGPFLTFGAHTLAEVVYRGRPAPLALTGAIAQAGDVQIELIQPLGEGPCAYRDTVPAGTLGFHHMGFIADDFEGELARYQSQGLEIASQGKVGGSRFAYVDTVATLGFMIELLDPDKASRWAFDLARRLALEWDGVHPSVRIQDVK